MSVSERLLQKGPLKKTEVLECPLKGEHQHKTGPLHTEANDE